MAVSPQTNTSGPLGIVLRLDGRAADTSYDIASIRVTHEVGRIPTCRLSLRDGSVASLEYPATDDGRLAPGTQIEVQAFWGGNGAKMIFSGLILGLRSRIDAASGAMLEIEARGNAILMAQERRTANFEDKSDHDVMRALVSRHGLTAKITGSSSPRNQVLHDATDWDFLRLLAERNGDWIICKGDSIDIAPPALAGSAPLRVTIGTDVMSFDCEVSANRALDTARLRAWDIAGLEVVEGTSAPPKAGRWGNLTPTKLADVAGTPKPVIASPSNLSQDALTGYATQIKARADLGRVTGTCRFTGSALAQPNTLLEISGAAGRFSGTALITGVRHDLSAGGWTTEVTLGRLCEAGVFAEPRSLPAGQGLATPVHGLTVATVTKLSDDPVNLERVEISLPVLGDAPITLWARLAAPYAGSGTGIMFLPEIGDEVVVGFFGDDPSSPVILGAMHSSKKARPLKAEAENPQKIIQTRSKLKLTFDDDGKSVTIETPGGAKVALDDSGGLVTLEDQNGNSIILGSSGIRLKSSKAISLTAGAGITLSAGSDAKITATNISAEANAGLTVKGNASAELSAGGQVTVKGAMVMIN